MSETASRIRLEQFVVRYSPEVAALARESLARMRERLPGAVELVYDNYNALVIGFGPTERASEAFLSIALYPRWVNLYFLNGAKLPDPKKLLKGNGKIVRYVRLKDAEELTRPALDSLIAAAVKRAKALFDGAQPGRIVIRAVSPEQRPRRRNP